MIRNIPIDNVNEYKLKSFIIFHRGPLYTLLLPFIDTRLQQTAGLSDEGSEAERTYQGR